jgi:hypothetical protein
MSCVVSCRVVSCRVVSCRVVSCRVCYWLRSVNEGELPETITEAGAQGDHVLQRSAHLHAGHIVDRVDLLRAVVYDGPERWGGGREGGRTRKVGL